MSEKHEQKSPEDNVVKNNPNEGKTKPQQIKFLSGKYLGYFGEIQKFFNSNTTTGRANAAKATYVGIFLTYLYFRANRTEKLSPYDQLSSEYKLSHGNEDDYFVINDDLHSHDNKTGVVDSSNNHDKIEITPPPVLNNDDDNSKLYIDGTNYKTDIKFSTDLSDVPKSLPETKLNNIQKNSDVEEIRESVALNKLKKRISQNPRYMRDS